MKIVTEESKCARDRMKWKRVGFRFRLVDSFGFWISLTTNHIHSITHITYICTHPAHIHSVPKYETREKKKRETQLKLKANMDLRLLLLFEIFFELYIENETT